MTKTQGSGAVFFLLYRKLYSLGWVMIGHQEELVLFTKKTGNYQN
jgi:hypothetical protein